MSSKDGNSPDPISFRPEDKTLMDYIDLKHEEGEFKDRTHVINTALKRMRDNDNRDQLV